MPIPDQVQRRTPLSPDPRGAGACVPRQRELAGGRFTLPSFPRAEWAPAAVGQWLILCQGVCSFEAPFLPGEPAP